VYQLSVAALYQFTTAADKRISELLGGTVFRDGVPATGDETKQQKLAA